MKFYFFHLMPWPHLPDDFDEKYNSAWVTLPNEIYKPELGVGLYNRYLDELEYADKVGFDGICVNEHHQNAYGNMPSPNLMAAALVRRTKNAKIAILGNALPLRANPLRIAEEIAMLDVMSNGRIISGFVRGIGAEYYSLNMDPTESRERFLEAHDLIIKAWTEPGPFPFEGKYYRYKYVNIWPRPLQKPHPPIWLPSSGSIETIQWAAERRYPFCSVFTPVENIKRMFDQYREHCETLGYEPHPEQLGFAAGPYVAETDAKAREELEPHVMWFFQKAFKMPMEYLLPPGYVTEKSLRMMIAQGFKHPSEMSFDELDKLGMLTYGSPKTVIDKLKDRYKELGGYGFLVSGVAGNIPHWKVIKSADLMATEVMPVLRKEFPT
jgi:alkanesulfonate monooxygenase SsuD/methylene tetrahydromethanopterin reductase-like flavin-dependent oxidoreductase (luciferase family)